MTRERLERGVCVEPRKGLRVLAIAPHPDDIELGCGATIMRLIDEYDADCFYLVLSSQQATRNLDDRRDETVRAAIRLGIPMDEFARRIFGLYECFGRWLRYQDVAKRLRQQILGRKAPLKDRASSEPPNTHVMIENYHDMRFPNYWEDIQKRLKDIRDTVRPDLILLPTVDDAHQDHVTTAECANREFRGGESRWYYEILQFDERIFIPSLFLDAGGVTVWAREIDLRDDDAGRQDREWFLEKSLGVLGALVASEKLAKCSRVYRQNPVLVDKQGIPVQRGRDARYKVYFKKGTYAERKADLLVECFRSQRHRVYFDPELVMGNMASRGMQCGMNVKYAEAYLARISV